MTTERFPPGEEPSHPDAITLGYVWCQFKRDVFDKETQSAATYSYMWIADQVGHIGVGMLLYLVPASIFVADGVSIWWLLFALAVPAIWEFQTYRSTQARYNRMFPPDRAGLLANVATATVYMWIGVLLGIGYMLGGVWSLIVFLGMVIIAAVMVPWWLRQKITWQKAALPYLSRLGTVDCPIAADPDEARRVADKIQESFVDAACDVGSEPRQLVISGPIGSGRTRLTAAIGTELCFRRRMVRYLSFDKLLEMIREGERDERLKPIYSGPDNIVYWRWRDADVLIIDDINAALLPLADDSRPDLDRFEQLSNQVLAPGSGLALRDLQKLKECHTVWVIGAVEDPTAWAKLIGEICGASASRPPIEVHLDSVLLEADRHANVIRKLSGVPL